MKNLTKISFNKVISIKFLAVIGCLLLTLGSAKTTSAQETDVYPLPDSYKTEGIPTIKKSEVENLFYEPSTIRSNLIWDADRKNKRLLVTDEKNNVYLLDSPLSKPVHLIEKIIPDSLKVRPDGESFAYRSDHENEDNYQLYLYNFKDKSTKKLTVLSGKDESVESYAWSKTGDSLFYAKVDYDSKTSQICQSDLLSEKCFPADLKGIWSVIDAGENKILLKYWKASSSQFLYIYEAQPNKLTPIEEKGNSRKGFLVGERVFWTSEGSEICGKQPCVLSLNLKNGQSKKLNLPENLSNFSDLKFSPDGNHLLVQESKKGIDNLRTFRLKNGKIIRELPPFINGSFVIWKTRWFSDKEIVYTLENNGKPASIWAYDIESKKIINWTKERLPAQLENKVRSTEVISWKSFDGKEIPGYIVRPETSAKKSPVLIYVHGGPQVLDKPVFDLEDIRLVSNLGMAIVHTNIRGSSGFSDEYMDADNQEKRGDAVKDIQTLLDWIGKQPDLDAGQIYLRGESYGGFVVLSAALQEPKRIKGVIAESPLVSIRGMLSQSWIDEFAKNEYGDPKDEDLMSKLDTISPLNNTNRWNKIPLFLTRGKLDSRSPEKDVTDLKTQLQNKDSEVWFIYSTDGGHGFGGRYVTAAMFQFLQKQINKNRQE